MVRIRCISARLSRAALSLSSRASESDRVKIWNWISRSPSVGRVSLVNSWVSVIAAVRSASIRANVSATSGGTDWCGLMWIC